MVEATTKKLIAYAILTISPIGSLRPFTGKIHNSTGSFKIDALTVRTVAIEFIGFDSKTS